MVREIEKYQIEVAAYQEETKQIDNNSKQNEEKLARVE
jgi:hypothetical protein